MQRLQKNAQLALSTVVIFTMWSFRPDCGNEGFFAGVAQANGVDLLNVVPTTGSSATATANLAQGQLVCVQTIGRAGQNRRYYYVAAIPASTIAR